nr:hypothetical protein [Tanacetum cinerariifolium]
MDSLLANGFDIDAVDKDGQTALHRAVIGKKEAVISHLLRKGASPHVQDLDDKRNSSKGSGVYTFRVQGGIYHRIDQLVPRDGDPRVELTASVKVDQRLYNHPTTSEVAGIWVEGNENITTYKKSIVVYGRSEYPTHIQPYFACYDPLSYPLFFPNGEVGWHSRIPREGVDIRELVDDEDDIPEDEEVRADLYQGIDDCVNVGEVQSNRLGQIIVLTVSFIGGPRDKRRRFLDAMTLVQDAEKPDIFLTMTCNLNWPKIVENLYEGQTAQDRPDLVTRVFYAKLEYLKHQLFTKHILGVVSSHVYVIEFQKKGLPHAHFLLILTSADKLANPDHYNKVVCAEIPDPNKQPELHQLVLKHMIHGPCGHLNTQCPCMEGELKKCRWNYPRQFQETMQQGDDSYPLYRRRDNGIEYVYKGHDKQVVNVDKEGEQVVNEIKRFQDARYVSPHEAMWRIYGFPLSNIYLSVMSLQVYLPNKQFITFEEDVVLTDILEKERNKRSMLTAFFELNQTDTEARQHLYKDISKFYTWNKSTRK